MCGGSPADETFICGDNSIHSVSGVNVITARRIQEMPQVYIRDDIYHSIIELGIKRREEIRDFVNDAVQGTVLNQQEKKNMEESKDE